MADQNKPQFDEERDRSDRTVEIGGERMAQKLRDHREASPTLTGGDVDADREQGGGDATQPKTDNTQPRTPHLDVAVIWKLRPDKTLEPARIRTGITDHTVTEVAQVLSGQVNEGDQLVTGAMTSSSSSGSRPPGMGGAGAPRR